MEDKRCCGSGSCIINAEGVCWCGQKWDGEKMVPVILDNQKSEEVKKAQYEIINAIYSSLCDIDCPIYTDMCTCFLK